MAAGDLFRARINFEHNAEFGSIGLDYEQTGDSTSGDDAGLCAAAVAVNIVPGILPIISEQVQVLSVQCYGVFRDQDNPGLTTFAGESGNRTGPPAPFITSLLIRRNQSLIGAKGNGRAYLPGVAESDIAEGVLDTASLDAELTTLSGLLTNQIGADDAGGTVTFRPVVLRPFIPPPPALPTVVASPVTSVTFRDILSRQRRRRSKRLGPGP